MCIAIPAEILDIHDNTALVDFGELKQEIRIDLVDVKIGDYVLVHVGFAIQKLNKDDALETRELFRQCFSAMEVA